mgnify:CR=1 FL=1
MFFKKCVRGLYTRKLRNYLLYAIGEIFLVVIGILIAIQIHNWNDLRKSKKQLKSQIVSLKNEISINIKQNKHYINYYLILRQVFLFCFKRLGYIIGMS